MAASEQEVETGASALKYYVQTIDGFEASLVRWGTYENGAKLIVNTWDSFIPEVVPADRVQAAARTLYQEISDAGYATRVSLAQCYAAAHAVLVAVGRT